MIALAHHNLCHLPSRLRTQNWHTSAWLGCTLWGSLLCCPRCSQGNQGEPEVEAAWRFWKPVPHVVCLPCAWCLAGALWLLQRKLGPSCILHVLRPLTVVLTETGAHLIFLLRGQQHTSFMP